MKNAEEAALPSELERRLKLSTDHLREVRETLEELGRAAGALHRLFGVEQMQQLPNAAPPSRPVERAAKAQTQKGHTATTPPPVKGSRPPPSSAPSAPPAQDEVPEWRKVFPELSAEVPGRRK
ncbi:hypothetical protein [Archangium sp.]|uniref:hypothetical protein n=1 Tax=Archangium sp. TaxID=1872627 RepID=UPI002D24BE64|nr:hypothetical protein [Archangium sp.]HYO58935.1 hypothetical protein [Archangium sp.]